MTSLNDFATTYMCQSLPFGGVKHSGFDRFAGIEGLRGMCIPKVCGVAVPLHALFACGTLLQGERGGGGGLCLQTATERHRFGTAASPPCSMPCVPKIRGWQPCNHDGRPLL